MSIKTDIQKIAKTDILEEKINKLDKDIDPVIKSAIDSVTSTSYQYGDGTTKTTTSQTGSDTTTPGVVDGNGNTSNPSTGGNTNPNVNIPANNTTKEFDNTLNIGGNAGANGALPGSLGFGGSNNAISPNSSNTDASGSASNQSGIKGGKGVVPPGQGGPNSDNDVYRDKTTNDNNNTDNAKDEAGNDLDANTKENKKRETAWNYGMVYANVYRLGNLFTDNPFTWNMHISETAGDGVSGVAGSPVIEGVIGKIGDKWAAVMFRPLQDNDNVPEGWTDRNTPPLNPEYIAGVFWIASGPDMGPPDSTNNYDYSYTRAAIKVGQNYDITTPARAPHVPISYEFTPLGDLGIGYTVTYSRTGAANFTAPVIAVDCADVPPSHGYACPIIPPYLTETFPESDGFVLEFNGTGALAPPRDNNVPTSVKQGPSVLTLTDPDQEGQEYEVGMANPTGWYITNGDKALIIRLDGTIKDAVPNSILPYHKKSPMQYPK